MISKLVRMPIVLAFGPVINTHDYDKAVIGGNFPKNDNETGWDRVKRMFQTDEFGSMTEELNSIYQATFLGGFVGAIYGGFLGSRKSYTDFIDRNQATAFENHLDAKRKLQDQVTMGFAKNSFRFGWRLALFSFGLTGIATTVAVYRGKSSMYEYMIAGAATGAIYKFNLGLRGMTAGFLVGGVLGTIGGGVSMLLLKSTGMTMEEARYWQYKWRAQRDADIAAGHKNQMKEDPEYGSNELLDSHDSGVGEGKIDLKSLDLGVASKKEFAVATEKK